METVIIDYGMGNLLSVQRAFEKCGSDAVIIDNPLDLREAEHIVLPGVGAFPDAMNNLRDGGWIEELNRAVLEKETPILGICLGMQLLAERRHGKPHQKNKCKGCEHRSSVSSQAANKKAGAPCDSVKKSQKSSA